MWSTPWYLQILTGPAVPTHWHLCLRTLIAFTDGPKSLPHEAKPRFQSRPHCGCQVPQLPTCYCLAPTLGGALL